MGETPWYLQPPREGEPEPKTCLNCARGCKKDWPFDDCPHWTDLSSLLMVGGEWWRRPPEAGDPVPAFEIE